jgi:hypothetical protein
LTAPGETQGAGVEGVVLQDEPGALLGGKALLDEGEIQVIVAAVDFVADDGVAKMREMNADLMFAAGARFHADKRKS